MAAAALCGAFALPTAMANGQTPAADTGAIVGTGTFTAFVENMDRSLAFFHDVFHNVNDRQAYLTLLASSLKPDGRIAIIEQEFDDPIAKKWDVPEDRITREQVDGWIGAATLELTLADLDQIAKAVGQTAAGSASGGALAR